MKKLVFLIILIIANTVTAELPNVVAFVNDEPITSFEFQARKKMLIVVNNIQNPDVNTNKQLNSVVLNSLIEEQLLFQHSKKVNGKVSEEEVGNAIASIDERNKMPKGHLISYLKNHGVDLNSFKSQIKAELIKMNIMSYISRSVSVSPKEIDTAILSSNVKDAKISAQVFTSVGKDDKTLHKMYDLQKRLKSCDNLKESTYSKFANLVKIDENLTKLTPQLQSIIKDLDPNQTSSVFETDEGFKVVLVCNKEIIGLTADESNYVTNFLTNKRMSQKAQKFFGDLRKKAYIKVMLPT